MAEDDDIAVLKAKVKFLEDRTEALVDYVNKLWQFHSIHFEQRNGQDGTPLLILKQRTVPENDLQQPSNKGLAIYDDNPAAAQGRLILENHGADASIRSRSKNRDGSVSVK